MHSSHKQEPALEQDDDDNLIFMEGTEVYFGTQELAAAHIGKPPTPTPVVQKIDDSFPLPETKAPSTSIAATTLFQRPAVTKSTDIQKKNVLLERASEQNLSYPDSLNPCLTPILRQFSSCFAALFPNTVREEPHHLQPGERVLTL